MERPLSFRRILLKTALLFAAINLAFPALVPLSALGRVSAYNHLFPGRLRLPYGDQPARSYNLSLFQMEAMIASHEIAGQPKAADEYRVIVIGDSSAWGFLLPPDATLAAGINAGDYRLADGRRVRAYNLGYPVMSVTKDLLILSYAMEYQPDLILWPLTLESLPKDKQLFPPLVQNNLEQVRALSETYQLGLEIENGSSDKDWMQRTLIGQRRALADIFRLQLYGILWAATGIDQDLPETYTPRMEDLPADETFHDLQPPEVNPSDLAFEVLEAGAALAGEVPVFFINEPVFISSGENSDIRYNFYYPRWAYDDYRVFMASQAKEQDWQYLDLWDAVDPGEFTNSAVHLSPAGQLEMARRVGEAILEMED